MHSRASHTHKVAMVAREIADNIVRRAENDRGIAEVIKAAGGLDLAACEAAGLAHDLGHPPFGHAGESALDKALLALNPDGTTKTEDGFEGNAQSFRIVALLDHGRVRDEFIGLDLTNVTLAAILKYPFVRKTPFTAKKNRKFNAYRADEPAMKRVRSALLGVDADKEQQTLEASIMDLADDIAYAVHDLEDFFAAGAIDARAVTRKLDDAIVGAKTEASTPPRKRWRRPGRREAAKPVSWDFTKLTDPEDPFAKEAAALREKYGTYFNDNEFGAALDRAKELLGTMQDFTLPWDVVDLRTNLNEWVARFFAQLEVSSNRPYKNGPQVFLRPQAWHEIQALKVITSHFVVATPRMGILQRAQSQTVEVLVERLAQWLLARPKRHELPIGFLRVMEAAGVELLDAAPVAVAGAAAEMLPAEHYRAIADYICTMSDTEALLRAQWLSGTDHPGLSVASSAT